MTNISQEYIKEIHHLEVEIEVALVQYTQTGEYKYVVEAHNLQNKVDAERRMNNN
jgi:hypothetical protein